MPGPFARTEMLLGAEAMERLSRCRVAVFGVGGVGGYVAEALARSGVGALDLVDSDRVSITNLNRQILALHSTIGQYKVDVAAARVLDINPDCRVTARRVFFLPETQAQFDFSLYDYVVDAIDTVKGKLALIEQAQAAGAPVISSMGAGNKLDPSAFRVADIYQTSVCPLARIMRSECRKRGIRSLKVVYSTELPVRPEPGSALSAQENACPGAPKNTVRRDTPGSSAFVPAAAGLLLASEVVKDLCGKTRYGKHTGSGSGPVTSSNCGQENSIRSERIAYYEKIMDRVIRSAGRDGIPAAEHEWIRADLKELEAYYTSPEWREDYAADEAGLLPEGLKRGVLSQDGIWNLLDRFRDP